MANPDVVIIGGGIAGLATAYRLQQDAAAGEPPLRLRLFERAERFGGKIVTDREDGFVVEGGPDSIIPQKPWALELIREIGLGDDLLPSNDSRRVTRVLHRGRLEPLPEGLQLTGLSRWRDLRRSPLLSWPAKLRFAAERWVPARRSGPDESVADFVRRRFGEGALWSLAEPLLAHLHVADVERMSLVATYPRLAYLEAGWGSLARRAASPANRRTGSSPTGPIFWTLKGGMETLVGALVERLDPGVLTAGCGVARIRRTAAGPGYAVHLDDGRELAAGAVVLAAPAAAVGDLARDLDSGLAAKLSRIRYASMATLSLGYERSAVDHPLDGFGFLVPRREKRRVLACTWTSTKFDHRAPRDGALVRVFLGGVGSEELLAADDDALVRAVREDLAAIMGLTAEPRMARLHRWPRGYPQYDVGHLERVVEIEGALPPGVFLAGSAYYGVGLPDCVRSGSEAAGKVLDHLRRG